MQERLVDVVAPLVADREPAILGKPRQCRHTLMVEDSD